MDDDIDQLQELLGTAVPISPNGATFREDEDAYISPTENPQWGVKSSGVYMPSQKTIPALPAGVYTLSIDPNHNKMVFSGQKLLSDSLVPLDDEVSDRVVKGVQKFWASEEAFRKQSVLFKRGVLLWGPAGSGKTATVGFIVKDIVELNGIVLLLEENLGIRAIKTFREIEPTRPLVAVLEDIEETIKKYGEQHLLSLLDGEHQAEKIIYIATTNHPEDLGSRIVNRPSRFDEVIHIGMPNANSRRLYLRNKLTGSVKPDVIELWVEQTHGLSIAHLREVVVATQCLGKDFNKVLTRLKKMSIQIKSEKEFGANTGFSN